MNDDERSEHYSEQYTGDNHDEQIADLYDVSKQELEPPISLDSIVLSKVKKVAAEGERAVAFTSPKGKRNRKYWLMPNSLVACLVVSVMVGLVYRENAEQLSISDTVEFDYVPVQSKPQLMPMTPNEAEVLRPMIVRELKQEKLKQDQSNQDQSKQKKKMARAVQLAPSVAPAALQAKPIQAEYEDLLEEQSQKTEVLPEKMKIEERLAQIRRLRESGDLEGALRVLNHVISDYPSLELPDDIMALRSQKPAAKN